MAKDVSVAPKERINIKYVSSLGGAEEEVELPLKLLLVGDYKGKSDDSIIEGRRTISIDKNNFNDVLRESEIKKVISVKNELDPNATEDDALTVSLAFNSMKDFEPDSISENIPEIKKLKQMREALVALKTPLGNVREFRSQLKELLKDKDKCDQILAELKLSNDVAES